MGKKRNRWRNDSEWEKRRWTKSQRKAPVYSGRVRRILCNEPGVTFGSDARKIASEGMVSRGWVGWKCRKRASVHGQRQGRVGGSGAGRGWNSESMARDGTPRNQRESPLVRLSRLRGLSRWRNLDLALSCIFFSITRHAQFYWKFNDNQTHDTNNNTTWRNLSNFVNLLRSRWRNFLVQYYQCWSVKYLTWQGEKIYWLVWAPLTFG